MSSSTPTRPSRAEAYNFALAAAELAYNTRCEDVSVLDLRGRSPVTEFFVIATGTSPRQMRTVVDEIRDLGKKTGFAAWQTSGLESGRWILVDCVSVVCHVFDNDSRDFYDLELLWGDCPRIDWRKALNLPAAPAGRREATLRERYEETSGIENIEAEKEGTRLEGTRQTEPGDADIDEDAEEDSPVVLELPDESTGSNSVEFVEVDPPGKRRQRGRAVYPTPIADEDAIEGEPSMHIVDPRGGAAESLDEDEKERQAEDAADADVEAVSAEDLPPRKISTRPMGGVSAGLSSTLIGDSDEQEQTGTHGAIEDAQQDHQDEIPESHELAAETTTFAKPEGGQPGVDLSAERGPARRRRALTSRKGYGKPAPAASRPVNPRKAKAGVAKTKAAVGKPVAPSSRRAASAGKAARKSARAPASRARATPAKKHAKKAAPGKKKTATKKPPSAAKKKKA